MTNQQFFNTILQAIINEQEIDRYFNRQHGIKAKVIFPRVTFYAKWPAKFPKTAVFAHHSLSILWTPIAFPALITWQLLFVLFFKLRTKKQKKITSKNVLMNFTHNAEKLFRENISTEDVTIVTPPLKKRHSKGETPDQNVLSFLSFQECIEAIYLTFATLREVNQKHNNLLLQTYPLFQMCLTFIFLKNHLPSDCTLYFSNHYDRFAILFDRLEKINLKKVLLQHGVVLSTEYTVPHTLRNINKLYFFSESQKQEWRLFLENPEHVQYYPLKQTLKTTSIEPLSSPYSLLIVNQPKTTEIDIMLSKTLVEDIANINIFFKPHPRSSIKKENFPLKVIFLEKDLYPEVNYALGMDSTLLFEYENIGTKILRYKTLKEAIAITKKAFQEIRKEDIGSSND